MSAPPELAPAPWSPEGLVGLRLVSGTGESLGIVEGVVHDRLGHPKHLAFRDAGTGELRRVPLRVVRGVLGDEVRLAGPREGYHITRLGP